MLDELEKGYKILRHMGHSTDLIIKEMSNYIKQNHKIECDMTAINDILDKLGEKTIVLYELPGVIICLGIDFPYVIEYETMQYVTADGDHRFAKTNYRLNGKLVGYRIRNDHREEPNYVADLREIVRKNEMSRSSTYV